MVVSIGLALWTLRIGLGLRRLRIRKLRRSPGALQRHLRLAKPVLLMILAGFAAGLVSAAWLRGWGVFTTAHSLVSSAALVGFLVTGWLGRRLEKGRGRPVEAHAVAALVSVGLAVAAFFTGFVLLP